MGRQPGHAVRFAIALDILSLHCLHLTGRCKGLDWAEVVKEAEELRDGDEKVMRYWHDLPLAQSFLPLSGDEWSVCSDARKEDGWSWFVDINDSIREQAHTRHVWFCEVAHELLRRREEVVAAIIIGGEPKLLIDILIETKNPRPLPSEIASDPRFDGERQRVLRFYQLVE